mmetsp:Transcript_137651/g.239321  ORF Transcript_137651/g.239321 Transcript_137651/m.239321 type:complete len:308 (+) Transcript_137651:2007-2930(+)
MVLRQAPGITGPQARERPPIVAWVRVGVPLLQFQLQLMHPLVVCHCTDGTGNIDKCRVAQVHAHCECMLHCLCQVVRVLCEGALHEVHGPADGGHELQDGGHGCSSGAGRWGPQVSVIEDLCVDGVPEHGGVRCQVRRRHNAAGVLDFLCKPFGIGALVQPHGPLICNPPQGLGKDRLLDPVPLLHGYPIGAHDGGQRGKAGLVQELGAVGVDCSVLRHLPVLGQLGHGHDEGGPCEFAPPPVGHVQPLQLPGDCDGQAPFGGAAWLVDKHVRGGSRRGDLAGVDELCTLLFVVPGQNEGPSHWPGA